MLRLRRRHQQLQFDYLIMIEIQSLVIRLRRRRLLVGIHRRRRLQLLEHHKKVCRRLFPKCRLL
jgi:hypothetical protein